ncbi:hypothetical protein HJC23_008795 [Cyclotella cryptica]|uniref:Adhesin domain-containing protein n=1 Tax=Cyclotella cryptica TaxID=29204 RepID=A0ABD3PSN5_9STRA|eukprot:CCRYP_012214-RA/>CCRYP_012214-RA protein AED:0.06 eAED:0.06 QI:0/-1/0/1/-1/1/1/0/681
MLQQTLSHRHGHAFKLASISYHYFFLTRRSAAALPLLGTSNRKNPLRPPSRSAHLACANFFNASARKTHPSSDSKVYLNNNVRHFFATSHLNDENSHTSSQSARILVPALGQNGTLVLRSKSKSISKVQIVPQWRDDTLLEMVHEEDAPVEDTSDITTITAEPSFTTQSSAQQQNFRGMRLTFHKDGIKTSLGRLGSLVEVDLLGPHLETEDTERHPSHDSTNSLSNSLSWTLIATVPEKSNITCQLASGDIVVAGKLEGDAHLSTASSNITVTKLRGHNVTLNNAANVERTSNGEQFSGEKGTIYVSKAIEARTVQISASGRVRARMINGSDINIHVNPSKMPTENTKLDEDDEGAFIDIGSLYVSHGAGECEARLSINATNLNSNHSSSSPNVGLARVKSSHGHVTVQAKVDNTYLQVSKKPTLVDLGGVNGSCDVLLEAPQPSNQCDSNIQQNDCVATRVHFDAFAPESISTITSRGKVGETSITIDRKLDADLRLLSLAKSSMALPDKLDAHSISSDDVEEISSALDELDELACQHSSEQTRDSILIETDAFQYDRDAENPDSHSQHGVDYIQGTMKNRSGEPDSRFDIQSRGKINIDGAASQALHGFHSKTSEGGIHDDKSRFPLVVLPLLCVASDGRIKIETLSWLGSIARRYGLEESNKSRIGRQASRTPRLEK